MKVKVFNGRFVLSGLGQKKIIVATTSRKKLSEILGISIGYARDYFSETGNLKQIEVTTKKPNVIFYSNADDDNYKEFNK